MWLSQDSDWLTGDTRADSLFRHEFSLKSEPKRALLLVAGLGYFKATIVSQALVSHAVGVPRDDQEEGAVSSHQYH